MCTEDESSINSDLNKGFNLSSSYLDEEEFQYKQQQQQQQYQLQKKQKQKQERCKIYEQYNKTKKTIFLDKLGVKFQVNSCPGSAQKIEKKEQQQFYQSGIKKSLNSQTQQLLNESELKDYINLCNMINDEIYDDELTKYFILLFFSMNMKKKKKNSRHVDDKKIKIMESSSKKNSPIQLQDQVEKQEKEQYSQDIQCSNKFQQQKCIINGSLPELPQSQSGEKIRMRQYKKSVIGNIGSSARMDSCPICLSDYLSMGRKFKVISLEPCQHIMCQECILEWARKYKQNCPVCRSAFNSIWPLNWISEFELKYHDQPLEFFIEEKQWSIDNDDFYYENDDQTNDYCQICNKNINFNIMLVCDECNKDVCHTYCDPAIKAQRIPEDEWYCMKCRASEDCYSISKKQMREICKQKVQRQSKREIQQQKQERDQLDRLWQDHNYLMGGFRQRSNRQRLQILNSSRYHRRHARSRSTRIIND